ncbi:DALR anticodon-binding domain-containing protein, partial [Synechococcus sp. GFB01]|uniref:DALR anticodon-binding domain-containing protein n=1 Tax=Synechococcus sp. GFB01 TaxID=1662190 RepID=UPI00064EA652
LLRDPADARQRADLLMALRRSGELEAVQAVVTRAARLAEKGDLDGAVLSPAGVVEAELFEQPSELAMLQVLERLEPLASPAAEPHGGRVQRYAALASALAASASTLAAFFDGEQSVMVMAEDAAIRRNRLNLLAVLRNQASALADFSRIAG